MTLISVDDVVELDTQSRKRSILQHSTSSVGDRGRGQPVLDQKLFRGFRGAFDRHHRSGSSGFPSRETFRQCIEVGFAFGRIHILQSALDLFDVRGQGAGGDADDAGSLSSDRHRHSCANPCFPSSRLDRCLASSGRCRVGRHFLQKFLLGRCAGRESTVGNDVGAGNVLGLGGHRASSPPTRRSATGATR